MNVKTNTTRVDGTAVVQVVAVEDGHRRYLGLYAKSGSCFISVGNGEHADEMITIAQGNIFESTATYGDKISYTGVGTQLLVIMDIDRPTILTYENTVLTYVDVTLTYRNEDYSRHLPDPVFK